MTTTPDPDSSGGVVTMGMDSGDTGDTDSPTTDAPTTDAPTTDGEECGNGMAGGDEDCDGEDLAGADCESQGFGGGALACNADCTFDTSGCTKGPACGDGVVDAGEDCDGADLDGATCESQGFDGGRLACGDACTFDTSGCTAAPACGNGAIDGMEACDGADLDGQDCVSQGFAGGGVLACLGDCTGFDTAGCMGGGGSDCCVAHMGTGCDNAACEASVCAADAFCCSNSWDDICAGEAAADPACAGLCGMAPVCGDGVAAAPEACDGADLLGEDCVSQGFAGGGVLACLGDCSGFDTAGCMGGGGGSDCCTAHAGTGCDNAACEASVCAADAFCCSNSWDDICAGEAAADPACAGLCGGMAPVCGDAVIAAPEVCDGANLGGQTCVSQGFAGGGVLACSVDCLTFNTAGCMGGGGGSDCCTAHAGTGCDNAACEASVCAADAFCCSNSWDDICAGEAAADPACAGLCGGMAAVCGDAVIAAPEVCDGANLGGQTCVSQGFAGGGVLACSVDCLTFNTAGCMGGGGGSDCCTAHAGTGCDNAACEASVCAADAFCCSNSWDDICAGEAAADPACAGLCP